MQSLVANSSEFRGQHRFRSASPALLSSPVHEAAKDPYHAQIYLIKGRTLAFVRQVGERKVKVMLCDGKNVTPPTSITIDAIRKAIGKERTPLVVHGEEVVIRINDAILELAWME